MATERPTQAPRTNNPIEQPAANPDHIEQFDYRQTPITDVPENILLNRIPATTSDALTEELQSPARFRENPIVTPPAKQSFKERFKKLPRKQKALAYIGVGATGLAVGVLPFASQLSATEYTVTKDGDVLTNGNTSAPLIPGEVNNSTEGVEEQPLDPATTNPERFKDQSYDFILKETVPILAEQREESLAEIDKYYADNNYEPLPTRDSIDTTLEEVKVLQDINRTIAADTYTITSLADSDLTLAKNLAAAVYKPDSAAYEAFIEDIETASTTGQFTISKMSAVAVSPELYSGTIANTYTINDSTPVIIALNDNLNRPTNEGTMVTYPLVNRIMSKHNVDGENHYVVDMTIQQDSDSFITYPEQYMPAGSK